MAFCTYSLKCFSRKSCHGVSRLQNQCFKQPFICLMIIMIIMIVIIENHDNEFFSSGVLCCRHCHFTLLFTLIYCHFTLLYLTLCWKKFHCRNLPNKDPKRCHKPIFLPESNCDQDNLMQNLEWSNFFEWD